MFPCCSDLVLKSTVHPACLFPGSYQLLLPQAEGSQGVLVDGPKGRQNVCAQKKRLISPWRHRHTAMGCCRSGGAVCAAALHSGTAVGAAPALPLSPLLALVSCQVMLHRDWRAPPCQGGSTIPVPAETGRGCGHTKDDFAGFNAGGFHFWVLGAERQLSPYPDSPDCGRAGSEQAEAGQRCQAGDMSWHMCSYLSFP